MSTRRAAQVDLLVIALSLSLGGCARRNAASRDLDPQTGGWQLGQAYIYRLTLSSAVTLGKDKQAFDFDLLGNVELAATKVTANEVTLYARVPDARVVSRLPGARPELEQVAQQVRDGGWFVTLSGGQVAELRVPRPRSDMALNIYRELASALQFVRTKDASERYTSEEYDTTGRYIAEYEFDPGHLLWHKKKQRYLALLGATSASQGAPLRIVPTVVGSSGEVRLSAAGRPLYVRLDNEVALDGAQAPVRSRASIVLDGLESSSGIARALDFETLSSHMDRLDPAQPVAMKASIESLDDARIGTLTFEQVIAQLKVNAAKHAASTPGDRASGGAPGNLEQQEREQAVGEDARLFAALSAMFRQQPAAVDKALDQIRKKSAFSDLLINALSASSSPAAQDAIIKLMSAGTLDVNARNRLITTLGRTPRPTTKSVAALQAVLAGDPFNRAALYGIGTFSRRLRDDGEVEQARATGEFLLSQLRAANESSALITVLYALANSGYAAALPAVQRYLTDERELVRVAAVRALQSMRHPQVDDIIASRLHADPATEVQVSAIAAAQVREPSAVLTHAVVAAVKDAPDARVRYRAVELMTRWLPRRPELRPALEEVARTDTEALIRERAKAAL